MTRKAGAGSRSIGGDGLLYLVASLAPPISTVLITPVITSALSAAEYGRVANLLVVMQLLGMVFALGAPSLITRETVIDGGQGVVAGRRLVVTMAVVLPGAGASLMLLDHLLSGVADGVGAAAIAGSGIALVSCVQALLRGMHRVAAFVGLAFGMALLGPFLGMALVLVARDTADFYLIGLGIGYGLVSLCALLLVRPFSGLIAGRSVPGYLGESLPLLPHQVAMYAATGLLIVMAGRVLELGPSGAGSMNIAVLAGTPPLLFLTALNNAWAPHIYETPRDTRSLAVSASAEPIMWLMAAVSVLTALAAPMVVTVLAPPWAISAGAAAAAGLACAAAMFAVIYLGNMHLLFSAGKARSLWFTSPVSLACAVGLASVMAEGRSTVTLLAAGLPLFYLFQAGATRLLLATKIGDTWSLRSSFVPFLVGLTGCAAAAMLPPDREGWTIRLVAALVIAAAALVVLILRVRRRAAPDQRFDEVSVRAKR